MTRQRVQYSLDVIIAVGYRMNTKRDTNSVNARPNSLKSTRSKATQSTKTAWKQKQLEIQTLKDGIHIINRAIEEKIKQWF